MTFKSAILKSLIMTLVLSCSFPGAAEAKDFQYYADSLRLDFNALRRQDAQDFTGILLQMDGSDNSTKEILLSWNSATNSAKILTVNAQDIRTYNIDSLEWPQRPESITVSVTFYFRQNRAVINLSGNQVVISDAGLSLNVGYNVSVLPTLSKRPDPNIPAVVEYTDLVISSTQAKQNHRVWIWLAGIILADLILSIVVWFNQKKKKSNGEITGDNAVSSPKTDAFSLDTLPEKSSILLFGGFRVYDNEGEDISRLFSPMLRELLTLIVIYSADKGISSAKLKEELWEDKDLKSARNNRAVYIRKLRSLLDKVGSYTLDISSGYWLLGSDEIFIDYPRFQSFKGSELSFEEAGGMMSLVQRGPLLPEMDSPWLDSFKAEAADTVIDSLGVLADDPRCEKKTEFALCVADTILRFDDLNEKALHLKCRAYALSGRHSSAKAAYDQFAQRYREIYGSNFQYDFTQLINTPSDTL